jgi:hypothetical protein
MQSQVDEFELVRTISPKSLRRSERGDVDEEDLCDIDEIDFSEFFPRGSTLEQ